MRKWESPGEVMLHDMWVNLKRQSTDLTFWLENWEGDERFIIASHLTNISLLWLLIHYEPWCMCVCLCVYVLIEMCLVLCIVYYTDRRGTLLMWTGKWNNLRNYIAQYIFYKYGWTEAPKVSVICSDVDSVNQNWGQKAFWGYDSRPFTFPSIIPLF